MSATQSLSRRFLLRVMGAEILAPALRTLGRGLLSIFTLHRFTDPDLGVVGHDPALLRYHLAYLRRHHYRLFSLTDVVRQIENGGTGGWGGGAPAVAFTVDDGYAGFARIAAPIFAEYDCPVTLFVTTGFLDGQLWLWWDRVTYLFKHTQRSSLVFRLGGEERAYRWSTSGERDEAQHDVLRRLEWIDAPLREATIAGLSRQFDVEVPANPPPACAPISWDEVRRTAKLGVTFGPHTVTHPILSLASEDVCRWEIEESCRRLRQETDAWVPVFCYPNGEPRSFGQREVEATQRMGCRAALTTVRDYAAARHARPQGALERFALPRFPYPDDTPHFVNVVAGLARLKQRLHRLHGGVLRPGLTSA